MPTEFSLETEQRRLKNAELLIKDLEERLRKLERSNKDQEDHNERIEDRVIELERSLEHLLYTTRK